MFFPRSYRHLHSYVYCLHSRPFRSETVWKSCKKVPIFGRFIKHGGLPQLGLSSRGFCTSSRSPSSRKLSELECGILNAVNQSVNVGALNLESDVPLDLEHVRQALHIVTRRQPLLTSTLSIDAEENLIFKEEGKRIELVKREQNATDWVNIWEEEHLEEFDLANDPLWRVKVLKECYNTEKSNYQNTLIFSFHPVISDSYSIATLMSSFLQSLELIATGKTSKAHEEHKKHVFSFLSCMTGDMLSELLDFTFYNDLWRKYYMEREKRSPKPFKLPKNIYCCKNPPVIQRKPDVHTTTSIYNMKLSREETASVMKACKTKGDIKVCTMEGAALAAALYAMSLMVWKDDARKTLYVPFSMNVNVRPICVPRIAKNYFGNFGSAFDLKMDVPPVDNEKIPEWFWMLANECSYKSSKNFKNCEFYRNIQADLTNAPLRDSLRNAIDNNPGARTGHTFNFSFMDDVEVDRQRDHKYTLGGFYHGLSGHIYGPAFCHNLVLTDDQLMWSLIYYTNISTKEDAEHMAELALEILLDAVEENIEVDEFFV